MSKDSLIKGTLILAIAAIIARVLGVIYRIPLQRLLDDSGMATYAIAYNLYFVFLVIATAGIPSALSKLISEKWELGQAAEARRIYHAAVLFAIVAGLAVTSLIWIFADQYAVHVSRDPDSALAIRALAPALLLFPLIAMMRGYFNGRQFMLAAGLSQVVEQIMRVIPAILLAYVFLMLGFGQKWAAAGASFGGVTGSIGAFAVMLYYWRKFKQQDAKLEAQQRQSARLPMRRIYASIFKLSVPVSLVAMAVPVVYVIDSSTVITLLEGSASYERAKEALGILTGRAQALAGIPPILSIALSQSIVPIISAAFAKADLNRVNQQTSQALRISLIVCLPLILSICLAARPLNGFLFGNTVGTWVIIALVSGTLFQVIMMVTGSILLALGRPKIPMIHVLVGIIIKLVCNILLSPFFGIYGIILSTACCFAVIMVLNLYNLGKTVRLHILGWKWLRLAAVLLIVIAIGIGLELVWHPFIQQTSTFILYGVQAIMIGLVVVASYVILLVKCRVIEYDDILRLPSPLQKMMKKWL